MQVLTFARQQGAVYPSLAADGVQGRVVAGSKRLRVFTRAALATAGLLLVSMATTPAVAATSAKVGARCAPVGKTITVKGHRLRCVRIAGELKWKRIGTVTPPAQKTPTPATSTLPPSKPQDSEPARMSPWATTFTAEQLVYSAKRAMAAYVSAQAAANASTSLSTVTYYYQPEITADDRQFIESTTTRAVQAFHHLLPEPVVALTSLEESWAYAKGASLGIAFNNCGRPIPNSWGCWETSRNALLLFPKDAYSVTPTAVTRKPWDPGMLGAPAHEYFHAVQRKTSGGLGDFPAWFTEGTASVVGFYFTALAGAQTYEAGRKAMYDNSPFYLGDKAQVPLSSYTRYAGGSDLWPYGIGQIASEYLIASAGLEAVLRVFRFTGELQSFELGFAKAIGMPLSEFYSLFEQVKPQMRLPK